MVAGFGIEPNTPELMRLGCSRYTCPQLFGAGDENRTRNSRGTNPAAHRGHQPACRCCRFCGHQVHDPMLPRLAQYFKGLLFIQARRHHITVPDRFMSVPLLLSLLAGARAEHFPRWSVPVMSSPHWKQTERLVGAGDGGATAACATE